MRTAKLGSSCFAAADAELWYDSAVLDPNRGLANCEQAGWISMTQDECAGAATSGHALELFPKNGGELIEDPDKFVLLDDDFYLNAYRPRYCHQQRTYTSSSTGQVVLSRIQFRPHAVTGTPACDGLSSSYSVGCVCKRANLDLQVVHVFRAAAEPAAVSAAAGVPYPPSFPPAGPPPPPDVPAANVSHHPAAKYVLRRHAQAVGVLVIPTPCALGPSTRGFGIRTKTSNRGLACAQAGCMGQAKSSWLTNPDYRFAKQSISKDTTTHNGVCIAAWYDRDHDNAVNDISLYYMWVGASGCGNGRLWAHLLRKGPRLGGVLRLPRAARVPDAAAVAAAAVAAAARRRCRRRRPPTRSSTATRRRAARMPRKRS